MSPATSDSIEAMSDERTDRMTAFRSSHDLHRVSDERTDRIAPFRSSSPCGGLLGSVAVEYGGEVSLALFDGPTLAGGVVVELIALDLADAEVLGLGMGEVLT